jgi:hypothetical protein
MNDVNYSEVLKGGSPYVVQSYVSTKEEGSMRKTTAILGATLAVLVCGNVFAGNTKHEHPNLDQAAKTLAEANAAVIRAQQANEFDVGGHAQQAKDDVQQALTQIQAAVQYLNSGK